MLLILMPLACIGKRMKPTVVTTLTKPAFVRSATRLCKGPMAMRPVIYPSSFITLAEISKRSVPLQTRCGGHLRESKCLDRAWLRAPSGPPLAKCGDSLEMCRRRSFERLNTRLMFPRHWPLYLAPPSTSISGFSTRSAFFAPASLDLNYAIYTPLAQHLWTHRL